MLYLSILLHIYQPSTQFPEITKEITNSSYRLILKILERTQAHLTLNINASLTEQLAKLGGEDVIKGIKQLSQKGQLELTGSAAYHPLLPRLPADLMARQIRLNTQINQKYFGEIYRPEGFFPPEMAYSNSLSQVLERMNFSWVIIDEHGYPARRKMTKFDEIYIKKDVNKADSSYSDKTKKPLNIFFRNDDLSLAIAFSQTKTLKEFLHKANSYKTKGDSYVIVALDGETFGHHQPGQEQLLSDILSYKEIKKVTVLELKKYFHKERLIRPMTSCWGASNDDMRKKIYWSRWSYPGNPIHQLQWELTRLAIKSWSMSRNSLCHPELVSGSMGMPKRVRHDRIELFDKSLQSDQYWWASHKPYWHPEMIRRGAEMLKNVICENPQVSRATKKKAERLYYDIVEQGVKLYGKEVII